MADLTELQASLVTRVIGSGVDGTEQTAVASTPNQDLKVTDTLNIGGVQNNIIVSTTATEAKAGATRLIDRKILIIQPTDGDVWVGMTNAVTIATGIQVFKDQAVRWMIHNIPIYLIGNKASTNVRILEAK